MRAMNRAVDVDRRDPRDVAAAFLAGLTRGALAILVEHVAKLPGNVVQAFRLPDTADLKVNAVRKFADVRMFLYILREIGTYAGHGDTCFTAGTGGLYWRVGADGRPHGRPDTGPSSGAQTAGAAHAGAAALTFHVMQETGTLADHLFQLFREPLATVRGPSRRLRLPWAIFAT